MKKYITIISILALILVPTTSVLAHSVMSFDKTTVSATVGQTVQATVSVDPDEAKNYTVKLALDFPADILQVTGFTFAGNWTQLNQPGYDSIDNVNGKLVKTAGYPGGFITKATFGTVTFRVIKSGNAQVKVNSGSMVLDSNSQNQLSATPSFSITVSSPTPAPVPTPTPVTAPTPNVTVSSETTTEMVETSNQDEVQLASVESIVTNSEKTLLASAIDSVKSNKIGIAIVAVLLAMGAVVVFYLDRKTKGGLIKKLKKHFKR